MSDGMDCSPPTRSTVEMAGDTDLPVAASRCGFECLDRGWFDPLARNGSPPPCIPNVDPCRTEAGVLQQARPSLYGGRSSQRHPASVHRAAHERMDEYADSGTGLQFALPIDLSAVN
jgi:hypothetical protein